MALVVVHYESNGEVNSKTQKHVSHLFFWQYMYINGVSECGQEILLSRYQTAIISPPKDISYYQPAVLCTWKVTTQPSLWLQIKTVNFSLERSENCSKDYLELDGLGRRCGQDLVGSFVMKKPSMQMTFVSDYDTEAPGFLISFRAVGE